MAKTNDLLDYLYDTWPTAPILAIRMLADLRLHPDSRVAEIHWRLSTPSHSNITRILMNLSDIDLVRYKFLHKDHLNEPIRVWCLSKRGDILVAWTLK